MTKDAPRSFNQHIFFDPKGVYYGTDDGFQDDSFGEFGEFESFYASVAASRRANLHFVGAVGGLYCLNLVTCWRPSKITFFDINPHAIAYLRVILRVIQCSASKREFLDRLSNEDFEVEGEAEARIRENLALKQRNALPVTRGSPYKRSLERSWQYSLDRFDLTKSLLSEVPVELRTEGIHSESFGEFLRSNEDLWVYCSNIAEFTYSRLAFDHPANAVVSAIIYPGQVDILDLSAFGDQPVVVGCEIPMSAARVDETLIPDETPSLAGDEQGRALAAHCRAAGLPSEGRILQMGCGWGRLALGLLDYLEGEGEYEGLDHDKQQLRWAKDNVMAPHPRFTFHIANLRNPICNPEGTLRPLSFRFPYRDGQTEPRAGLDMVVIHGVSQYLTPDEIAHYVEEAARVLVPGGKLLVGVYRLDADSIDVPHPFHFSDEDDKVATTRPRGGGRVAYREAFVRAMMSAADLEIESIVPGSWRGITSGLAEDLIVARKSTV